MIENKKKNKATVSYKNDCSHLLPNCVKLGQLNAQKAPRLNCQGSQPHREVHLGRSNEHLLMMRPEVLSPRRSPAEYVSAASKPIATKCTPMFGKTVCESGNVSLGREDSADGLAHCSALLLLVQ